MPSATGPSHDVSGDTAGKVIDLSQVRAPRGGSDTLPSQITGFIGREREAAEVARLLAGTRLLTLPGPGGCGKTRLALAVSSALAAEETVWWVELASLPDPSLVPRAAAKVLGVRELPGRDHVEALIDALRKQRALLVLDNCEHLISACAGLTDALLRTCPELRIMATSRESLGIVGEVAWTVPPLSLPDVLDPGEVGRHDAVRLFVERARSVVPTLELDEKNARTIARLCRRLDGMPLAIELAAARARVLSLEQISARLDDALGLLSTGGRTAPPRQRTLRAMMDWSFGLLSEKERALFCRLSVFSGSFSLPAAEEACAGGRILKAEVLGLLTQLVEKSLVDAQTRGGEARYGLLGTIQQYGNEKLAERGEVSGLRLRHASYFLRLAEQAESGLSGAQQAAWLEHLATEHDNLRAALGWSLDEGGDPELGLRLASSLWRFCHTRGYYGEGREWLERTLARADNAPRKLRAKALTGAGLLAFLQCEYDRATTLLEMSLTLYRDSNDELGIASALQTLGSIARERGHYARAVAFHEESLALQRKQGNEGGIARALDGLGFVAWLQGDHVRARALCVEALARYRGLEDAEGVAWSLVNLGASAQHRGDLRRAKALLEESLEISRGAGYKEGIAWSLDQLGLVEQRGGDHRRATALLRESLEMHRDLEDRWRTASVLESLAGSLREQGQPERAARLLGAADALREVIGAPVPPCERADHDRAVATVRAGMGEKEFAEARAEGQMLSPQQILAELEEIPAVRPAGLTAREVEVLGLVAAGFSDPQVAEKLVISRRTVHAHMRSVHRKLEVTTRTAAVRFAVENGLA